MIIDLDSFEGSEKKFEMDLGPDDINLGEDAARLKGDVRVECSVSKTPIIEVKGTVKGSLELDCTRCLTAIPKPLNIDFDDVFLDASAMGAAPEGELARTDLNVDVLPGSQLDLGQLIREQILLSLPEQVFCKEGCRGLCERCGADLNTGSCGCAEEEVDPRWAALKNLKK